MKYKSLLIAAFMGTSLFASAQDTPPRDSVPTDWLKDIIKINLTSLPLKNIGLQYEYVLSRKVSIALSGRLMPTTSIPFQGLVEKLLAEDNQDAKDLIDKSRIGNFAITPEVRFYLGKGYGKGFYIAPYYRYVNFSTNTVTLNYSEPNGPKRSVNLNGELSAHTGGVMFGAQWFLGKQVALDWWIIGAHYGAGDGVFNGVPSTPLTPSEQANIRQTLEDIEIPLVEKTVNVTANNILVNLNGPFGGLRAGLSLGIRF